MTQTKNTFETIYEVGKFSARINGTDYEIVRNGLKVVETLRFEHYDEEEVVAYVDKCEYANNKILEIKTTIDNIINLGNSYKKFKNAVEVLDNLDTPNYMSYDVLDLTKKLIRMMVWASSPMFLTEDRNTEMMMFGMMNNDLNEVQKKIDEIIRK
jgi:ribosome-interacting GTPase 1